ncbi:MAG: hypothetical protein LPJ94_00405 [Thauera sp.]|nr:hypothetical protein [Thauera sp.]
MPIMIEEMHTQIRPEPEPAERDTGRGSGAAGGDLSPALGTALAEQIRRELRLREERRLRWQAD